MESFKSSANTAGQKPRFKLFSLRTLGFILVGAAALATLAGLFYVEENIRGKYAWETYEKEAIARGVNLDWQKFIPPAVPDSANFAMTPFLAPLLDIIPWPNHGSTWRDTNAVNRAQNFATELTDLFGSVRKSKPGGFWKDAPDMESFAAMLQASLKPPGPTNFSSRAEAAVYILKNIEPYKPVLDEIHAASQRPYSRFNIQYDAENPASILLPHLAALRRLATVFRIRSSAELALGRTDSASDDLDEIFYLADSVHNEPILISQLVRIAILGTACELIWEGIDAHKWTDAQLQAFQAKLRDLHPLKDSRWGIDSERVAFGVNLYDFFRKQPGFFRDVDFTDGNSKSSLAFAFLSYAPNGWIYQEQISHHRFFDVYITSSFDAKTTRVFPHVIEANTKALMANFSPYNALFHHHLVMNLIVPALSKICQKGATSQTLIDEARTACALERYRIAHGDAPETLEMLVPQFLSQVPMDVCNGAPLKYIRGQNGQFTLYSVGWNEKDDGGTSSDTSSTGVNEGDWVWPVCPVR